MPQVLTKGKVVKIFTAPISEKMYECDAELLEHIKDYPVTETTLLQDWFIRLKTTGQIRTRLIYASKN